MIIPVSTRPITHTAFTAAIRERVPRIWQPCSINRLGTTIRVSTSFEDHPNVIDSDASPAPSTTSALCKVNSIPIHPPH
jgi:hypothetical protein